MWARSLPSTASPLVPQGLAALGDCQAGLQPPKPPEPRHAAPRPRLADQTGDQSQYARGRPMDLKDSAPIRSVVNRADQSSGLTLIRADTVSPPPSAPIEAAAAKQENDNDDYKERIRVHIFLLVVVLVRRKVRGPTSYLLKLAEGLIRRPCDCASFTMASVTPSARCGACLAPEEGFARPSPSTHWPCYPNTRRPPPS